MVEANLTGHENNAADLAKALKSLNMEIKSYVSKLIRNMSEPDIEMWRGCRCLMVILGV